MPAATGAGGLSEAVRLYLSSMTVSRGRLQMRKTHRVGAKGQVVIPKQLRDRAGIQPGSEVDFELDGDRVIVAAKRKQRPLGGRFAGGPDMASQLLEDRRREPR